MNAHHISVDYSSATTRLNLHNRLCESTWSWRRDLWKCAQIERRAYFVDVFGFLSFLKIKWKYFVMKEWNFLVKWILQTFFFVDVNTKRFFMSINQCKLFEIIDDFLIRCLNRLYVGLLWCEWCKSVLTKIESISIRMAYTDKFFPIFRANVFFFKLFSDSLGESRFVWFWEICKFFQIEIVFGRKLVHPRESVQPTHFFEPKFCLTFL